jgi:hypothetical protein
MLRLGVAELIVVFLWRRLTVARSTSGSSRWFSRFIWLFAG